jgi:hypothetical protein
VLLGVVGRELVQQPRDEQLLVLHVLPFVVGERAKRQMM